MARPFLILTAICLALAGSALAGTAGWHEPTGGRARASLEDTSGPAEKQLLEKFAPSLLLAGDGFKPEAVTIMTSDSNGIAEAQLKEDAPGPDPVLLDSPTLGQLCSFGTEGTYLDIRNLGPVLDEDGYWSRYRAIEASYQDAAYARVMYSAGNVTALQYWFFYYFNDWYANHEGDWETITLVLPPGSGSSAVRLRAPTPSSAQSRFAASSAIRR